MTGERAAVTRSGRDVGEELLRELGRIAQLNPFEVLGVPPTANQEQIRTAFLAATKKFHPNKFARESATTLEAANEVFLVIRRAYGQLTDDGKRRRWKQKLGLSSGPVALRRKGTGEPMESAPPPSMSTVVMPVPPPANYP